MSNLKNLTRDVRIRGILQKHMTALSHEIAQELTQPLLEHWGLAMPTEDAAPEYVTKPFAVAPTLEPGTKPGTGTQLLFDRVARQWVCPRCLKFMDLRRRAVSMHLRSCDAVPAPRARRRANKKKS